MSNPHGATTVNEPITQAQDDSTELAEVHDRRIACPCENRGLEGIMEQLAEQTGQTHARLDRLEQAITTQGHQLRQEIAYARARFAARDRRARRSYRLATPPY